MEAPPRGYWNQGPRFRGYSPRPSWDYFGPTPSDYQYGPQNYHAKRPRYDQFHGYPKRPRYQANWGNAYGNDDPFYDKFMLENPWRELLPKGDTVDSLAEAAARCGNEPAISDALHAPENTTTSHVSLAIPSSPEKCLDAGDPTSSGAPMASGEPISSERTSSLYCDDTLVAEKPSCVDGPNVCGGLVALGSSHGGDLLAFDDQMTPPVSQSCTSAGSDELVPTIDGGSLPADISSTVESVPPSDQS